MKTVFARLAGLLIGILLAATIFGCSGGQFIGKDVGKDVADIKPLIDTAIREGATTLTNPASIETATPLIAGRDLKRERVDTNCPAPIPPTLVTPPTTACMKSFPAAEFYGVIDLSRLEPQSFAETFMCNKDDFPPYLKDTAWLIKLANSTVGETGAVDDKFSSFVSSLTEKPVATCFACGFTVSQNLNTAVEDDNPPIQEGEDQIAGGPLGCPQVMLVYTFSGPLTFDGIHQINDRLYAAVNNGNLIIGTKQFVEAPGKVDPPIISNIQNIMNMPMGFGFFVRAGSETANMINGRLFEVYPDFMPEMNFLGDSMELSLSSQALAQMRLIYGGMDVRQEATLKIAKAYVRIFDGLNVDKTRWFFEYPAADLRTELDTIRTNNETSCDNQQVIPYQTEGVPAQ